MKCQIPEISWHNRDPVLSIDIQPNSDANFYRLASGGTDSHVLIWHMTLTDTGSVNLELAADLARHQKAVNVVKWSPNSKYLVSGDDESVILIWKLKEESEPQNICDSTNDQDKETWIIQKILRGHMEDVYDIAWSPDSLFIVSGSVDNTAIVWDAQKGKTISLLNDHKGFVQGVSWDPTNQYIATLSTDRFLRVFDVQTKKVIARISKCDLPNFCNDSTNGKSVRIFHDDTLQTFFRRLSFSPDGKLLVTPAGTIESVTDPNISHTTYIFSKFSLKQPAIVLPSPDQYTVAVKFCPLLFTLHPFDENNKPIIPLPYRMVFAVATKSSVYLYDTQQKQPFGIISNIHYTRLTDMSWSSDGNILIVSSTDGFCSLVTFAEKELGEVYNVDDKINLEKESPNDNEVTSSQGKELCFNTPPKKELDLDLDSSDSLKKIIELDKTIISSEEKFETPEKKCRPVTPISIRRYPRTTLTPDMRNNGNIKQTEEMHNQLTETPKSVKIKSSIEAREKILLFEDAQTPWPSKMAEEDNKKEKCIIIKSPEKIPVQNDDTEDIRLVYEESQDNPVNTKQSNQTPSENQCKTPRRVKLTTLSTPKSAKRS